jgi:hypothetical protein
VFGHVFSRHRLNKSWQQSSDHGSCFYVLRGHAFTLAALTAQSERLCSYSSILSGRFLVCLLQRI